MSVRRPRRPSVFRQDHVAHHDELSGQVSLVAPIWTPTDASWLNPIECQFTPAKEFVIRNSDYAGHEELADALRRYANYRNQHAKRKKS